MVFKISHNFQLNQSSSFHVRCSKADALTEWEKEIQSSEKIAHCSALQIHVASYQRNSKKLKYVQQKSVDNEHQQKKVS